MLRELNKLVQSHPAHQCQKLDSSKPWYSWLLYTCPCGVWGVPVGDTGLPPSPCASAASPAFPSFHIFIHKTRGLFPSFDNVLWLCVLLSLGKTGWSITATLSTNFATPLELLKWFQSRKFKRYCRDKPLGIFLDVRHCVLHTDGAHKCLLMWLIWFLESGM